MMIALSFYIPFVPTDGERMALAWSKGDTEGVRAMDYDATHGLWHTSMACNQGEHHLSWHYKLIDRQGNGECEGAPDRSVVITTLGQDLAIHFFDFWRPPGDLLNVFSRAPFHERCFPRSRSTAQPIGEGKAPQVIVTVPAPAITHTESVYITGAPEILGAWQPKRALPLTPVEYPYWEIRLPHPIPHQFSYKYLIKDEETGTFSWEAGANRTASIFPQAITVINDWPLYPPDGLPRWAGITVPLFSLRSAMGLGVGEIRDLIPLIDWAAEAGLKTIALLPINDTHTTGSWADSYPYSIVSTCALHPLYLHLDDLMAPGNHLHSHIAVERHRLNALPTVDYPEVMRVKMGFLREIYRSLAPSFLTDPQVHAFLNEHASWLTPYAVFSYLRDRYGGVDVRRWSPYAQGTEDVIATLADPGAAHYPDLAFHYFVQYHLHRQLAHVTAHARSRGIVLKGDLPIGVSPASVEVWSHPSWFDRDHAAGAPPDDFSQTGQNWGFPLYRWEEMEKDGFLFWRERLTHLARFFQAVRLDHVLGFFRIWAIPQTSVTALQGRFIPSLPLSREELHVHNISDIDDLCAPLITDHTLERLFGPARHEIAHFYLEKISEDRYRFRPPFSTQRQLLAGLREGERYTAELLGLHDEVLFLREERAEGTFFHPRIRMWDTVRFQGLPLEMQQRLLHLTEDFFYRRHDPLWYATGMRRLQSLQKMTDLLLCGEDLGMVPAVVRPVLQRLGILCLRVERFPTALGEIFADLSHYPYLSVATPSTHDTTPIRTWWEDPDRAVIQYYYEHILGGQGIAPQVCDPSLAEKIIVRHLAAPSMFALFLLQDLLAIDGRLRRDDHRAERINDPAIPHFRWNFRFHLSVEDLRASPEFTARLRSLIRQSGRRV